MTPDDIFSRLYPAMQTNNDLSPSYRPDNNMTPHYHNNNSTLTPFPSETPVAMAYVPFQQWGAVNTPEVALMQGTLFPELDKPFERGRKR